MSLNYPQRLDEKTQQIAINELIRVEPSFSIVIDTYGPPPFWERKESFGSLIKIILEQQVSLASAHAAFDKLVAALVKVTPDNFLTLNDAQLKSIGFSRQKTSYARNLASAVKTGVLDLTRLSSCSDEDVRSSLISIKGIGVWTANVYILTAMQRPDIWPRGDIALAASYQMLKQIPQRPGSDEMEQVSRRWSPWRSVASRLLWHYYLSSKGK